MPASQAYTTTGLLLAAVALSGCSGDRGPERVTVSGAVAYNRKPIADGTIRFIPAPTCPVPVTTASIVDGKYTVDGHGGVPVGTHRIQIEAFRKVAVTLRPGEAPPRYYTDGGVRKQYLPKKFNADTTLEITVEPGSRQITKNFDLTD